MAKNDTVLLDGILDQRVSDEVPSTRRDEAFEYLAIEQILKDLDLSDEDLRFGIVDGRNDGGIDGFYILVNGHLLTDCESFMWPRAGAELEIRIITCKHHDTFRQAPLDNLTASLAELMDFSMSPSEFSSNYSEKVIQVRENLKLAFRRLSPNLTRFSVNITYASRGDAEQVGESVLARAQQTTATIRNSFSECDATFEFVGASELVALYRRRPPSSLELPFIELFGRDESYVLLAGLKSYFEFVTDHGKLRRYLFDSNVRDFMGLNRVNEDIRDTLSNPNSPDFWWLNNGVTILASAASVVGKSIVLSDIQIVNGLQTTESIFRHFNRSGSDPNSRSVLVKVIVATAPDVRDSIIRSTNNQTEVILASLHATDAIQRDIEDILLMHGLYYERRINYYKNQGHRPDHIVSPQYLAAGIVALVFKNPAAASNFRSRSLRPGGSYELIFSKALPIKVWPVVAKLLRRIDKILLQHKEVRDIESSWFLKNWRYLVAFIAVAKEFGTFAYPPKDLAEFSDDTISSESLEEIFNFVRSEISNIGRGRRVKAAAVAQACISAADKFEISQGDWWISEGRKPLIGSKKTDRTVTWEFALKVHNSLPDQPWKPGVHEQVIRSLNCSAGEYQAAVQLLIDRGYRNQQRDGVVYDSEGHVVAFDPERVDPETLELF